MISNSPVFDKELFGSMWKPVTSAIVFALMSFDDKYIVERAIEGFRQCATLAVHFQLPRALDYMVMLLSQATGLLPENSPSEVPLYPVVEVEGKSVTVSSLAVNFGAHVKGQIAFRILFDIIKRNGNAIREGWIQVRRFSLTSSRCLILWYSGVRHSFEPVQSFAAPHQNASDGGLLGCCFHHTFARKPWAADRASNGDEERHPSVNSFLVFDGAVQLCRRQSCS
jgi:Sec7-like guanine-nucleotide exchange factor